MVGREIVPNVLITILPSVLLVVAVILEKYLYQSSIYFQQGVDPTSTLLPVFHKVANNAGRFLIVKVHFKS